MPLLIAIAVVECDDRFLVGMRPDGPLAGYWEFPGGKVRLGETPADAAVRECLEETGVRISLGPLLARIQHAYDHGLLELHFYAAAPEDARSIPRPPFRWVSRAELATLRFPPANAAVLSQLCAAASS